jgi:hypothetical protein
LSLLVGFSELGRGNRRRIYSMEDYIVEFATCFDCRHEGCERGGNRGPFEGRHVLNFFIGNEVSIFDGNVPKGGTELLEFGNDVSAESAKNEKTDVVRERFPGHVGGDSSRKGGEVRTRSEREVFRLYPGGASSEKA